MAFNGHNTKRLLGLRRKLRHEQTDVEALLWRHLRARRVLGFKFNRQYGVGRYVIDFYCHEVKIGIELDGGQHNETSRRSYDGYSIYNRQEWSTVDNLWIVHQWRKAVHKAA